MAKVRVFRCCVQALNSSSCFLTFQRPSMPSWPTPVPFHPCRLPDPFRRRYRLQVDDRIRVRGHPPHGGTVRQPHAGTSRAPLEGV